MLQQAKWLVSYSWSMRNFLLRLVAKQYGQTEKVLTVRVKGPVFDHLIEVGEVVRGIVSCKKETNLSCEIPMCVSTAQARTKRARRNWGPAFFLYITQNCSCDLSMCVWAAQGHMCALICVLS